MQSGKSPSGRGHSASDRSLHPDQRAALAALLDGRCRFLIVEGYAFAAHAYIRATKDIDFWVDPESENARRVWAALGAWGAPSTAHGVTLEDFERDDTISQVGVEPARVDFITGLGTVPFGEAWERRVVVKLDGLEAPVLSLDDLIAEEKADREQDRLDVKQLYRVRSRRTST